ncbi:hypothetical protein [Cohnella cholangitidis]|uniref:VCBS repeat-containing protein n=1 Tax=Cohnella cholangitidis TaxID=2598458 RepID=A0A7G5BTR3_9BACL|nr:hypothetical protein [Cohnella cholangitidis]QMV40347.1 hypothetical protein FPL14_03360 [Cohnella cholangitidis]
MSKKRTIAMLIALMIIMTMIPTVNAASKMNKQQAVNSASASFMKEYKLGTNDLATPLIYDLNNDGKDEIILSTAKNEMVEADLYIGIYNLSNGKKITTRHDQDTSGIPFEIRKIKNKTYKNNIAIISHGTTGFGAFEVEVLTLRNGKLTKVAAIEVGGGGEGDIIADTNKDGYHEIVGLKVEPGSGEATAITFRWDESKKKYIQSKSNGAGEVQRKTSYWTQSGTSSFLQVLIAGETMQFSYCANGEVKHIPFTVKEDNGNVIKVTGIGEDGEDEGSLTLTVKNNSLQYSINSQNIVLKKATKKDFYSCAGIDISKKNHEYAFGGVAIGDSEQYMLNTFDESLTKDSRSGSTVYHGSLADLYVSNGKVQAIISDQSNYMLMSGIGVGSTLEQVLNIYGDLEFRRWEDSNVISAKTKDGMIVSFNFGMHSGGLVSDDSIVGLALYDEKFFKVLYAESYEDKMKKSSKISKAGPRL